MPSRRRPERSSPPRLPAHALLLEEPIPTWAGERSAQAGRREALLGRVEFLRLAPSGRLLEAKVRGNRPAPYRVQVWVEGGRLTARCTCAGEDGKICRHAVAAVEVLRFPLAPAPRGTRGRRRAAGRQPGRGRGKVTQPGAAQSGYLLFGGAERTLTREERVEAARDEERLQRKSRARRERATVVPLADEEGAPCFEVRSRRGGSHRVTLRGAKGRVANCTCEDFAENELQTCRHVERVRLWNLRKKKPQIDDLISVLWFPRNWPDEVPDPLREIRVEPEDVRSGKLSTYFESHGWLRPAPEGREGHEWCDQAISACRAAAVEAGRRFDLDPTVEEKIESARESRRAASRLAGVEPGSPIWREIVGNLGFRLHPYQEIGALFLAREGRAMLADEMGLGKTVQAIVAALLLRRMVDAKRALVVCPASLKHQWRREIEKACGEKACVVEGSRATRLAAYEGWRAGFLILNYELVLRDLEEIRKTAPDLVVLDEAQRIKNWDTKTARAVKSLDSPYAFILTGTPLENRLLELHSLVEFLHPRALGPRWRLLPFHAVTEPQGRIIAYEGLEIMRRRLSGFFLRRERRAVLDQLPERTDNAFWTGMTLAQRRPYRRHVQTIGSILRRNQALLPGEVRALLQALTSMRILCNAWAQYSWDRIEPRLRKPVWPTTGEIRALGSPKLEEFARVLEDLLDDGGTKIVVFSQWERMLRLAHFVVGELLHRRELRAEVFHGGLSAQARDRMLEAFRLDPEFHVLFSTDAGGLGLNLQETASIVVNLEVPWNPAVLEQRIGRVHRIGQRHSVQVLNFVTRGAIEERVRQIVEGKRALFEGLMGDTVDRVVLDDDSRSSLVQQVRRIVDSDSERSESYELALTRSPV